MLGSLYSAASAIAAQQRRMDAVANDVANADTTGYKPQRTGFEELVDAQGRPSGVAATDLGADFAQGPLEETGEPLDLAIEGSGFFQVRRPNGQVALTRDGSFRPDANGTLVTAAGDRLDPPVTLPAGVDPAAVAIGSDGTVRANGTAIGAVTVVEVPAPGGLVPAGGGLYAPGAASGAPRPATSASVRQGALEGSNTDFSDAAVGMIEARASTAAAGAAFRAQDAMLAALIGLDR